MSDSDDFLINVNDFNIFLKRYMDRNALNFTPDYLMKLRNGTLRSYIDNLENNDYEPVTYDDGITLTKEGVLIDCRTNLDRINNLLSTGGKKRKHTKKRKHSNKKRYSRRRRTNKRRC